MTQTNGLRLLIVADPGEAQLMISECVLTSLPTSTISSVAPEALRARSLPPGDCAVIDTRFDGRSGLDTLRLLRVGGFQGSAVLLLEQLEAQLVARAAGLGAARCVVRTEAATALPAALAEVAGGSGSVALRELRRVQLLLAIGETSASVQHAVNNPLTALLAEAQLLEMEDMSQEHKEAVHRIVDLCRRVVTQMQRLHVAGA